MMKKYISLLIILFISLNNIAQKPDRAPLTRETVLEMSIDDLADLDLEELMTAMDLLGVSSLEELIELLINRNVYSASGHNESTMVSPLSSSVLTRQEIRDYGATTIEEALRLIPGVIVRQKTNGNFDVHLRGLDNLPSNNMMLYSENTNTLLMIDGRPMFNYAHGAIVWESLPIGFEDIERIEVVRGPASALYGSNAVNGVINILTAKTNQDSPLVSGSVQGGTLNTYTGDIAIRKSWNKNLSAAVTTNYQHKGRDRDEIYIFRDSGEREIVLTDDQGNVIRENLNPGFYSLGEYERLYTRASNTDPNLISLARPQYSVYELFPDPDMARENIGVNTYLHYLTNNNNSYDFSAGYQNSFVNTTSIGDTPSPYSGRESSTAYANVSASVGDARIQTNYMFGRQDFAVGETGFEVDMGQFNANAEYDLNINTFNIRPGVSYQTLFYNDTPYLNEDEGGYLNGKKELNTLGLSLRLDYSVLQNLRLVSALRTEKYNNPDKWYTSWQFAGIMPINENHTIRAVYSRANRSSFIVNAHSNYLWDRTGRTPPNFVHFNGNPDADLLTTDMIELGYRIRPNNRILLDLELFASKTKNFGALMTERSVLDFSQSITPFILPISQVYISYQNLPLDAKQIGASFNLDWIISEKIITRFHGTIQETKLDNYSDYNRNQITEMQLGGPISQIIASYQNPNINSIETLLGAIWSGMIPFPSQLEEALTSNYQPTDLQNNVKHKNTPSFWGMAGVIYRPTQKWTIASDAYYYSKQTFHNLNGSMDIDSKLILNSKISYKATKNLDVFINARNLINDDTPEFGFMDNIGALYMGGIQFTF